MIIRRRLSVVLTAVFFAVLAASAPAQTSNVVVRIMAANLNGNTQSIQPFEINIFKGLKPDVVCIQEFNYSNNTPSDFRALLDNAFGTEYSYYRESGSLQIPNGIISRYPILASGRWVDTQVSNRGFAWARIDLPGSNDLYAVSVHLLTSGSGVRATEASNLKALILSNFPTNAWIVIGGDFNADSRSESCVTTFASLCPDAPVPTDAEGSSGGDADTNANRNKPYDYVLASHSLTNYLTNVVFNSRSFQRGLVFDSRVYTPLSDVSPVVSGDSGQGQHMAILKDFSIPASGSNAPVAPFVSSQPQSLTVPVGGTANFAVTATGTAPLAYQWRTNGTPISGALTNTYAITNAQVANNGNYTVVITNIAGSVTSAVATLTVSNIAPTIVTSPASLNVLVGNTAAFSVTASGTAPLAYQWRFNGTNISSATNEDYSFNNAQTNDAGSYAVLVTNAWGSATSAVATLTVSLPSTNSFTGLLAGWDVSGQLNFGISPLVPSTNALNLTFIGLTRGAGIATGGSAAARAWGGNGFDAANATAAVSSNDFATLGISANTGFQVSYSSISRFDYRRSGTGPTNGVLQYQIESGPFVDIASLPYGSGTTANSGASLAAIDLSGISSLQNIGPDTNVTFRIVNFGGASGGTWYVYDFANSTAPDLAIAGTVAPIAPPAGPPAIAPTLSTPSLTGNQFIFQLTGTATSNYVVQVSTNLSNWVPLQTNPAPFWFTNDIGQPQQFFRGTVAP